MVHRRFHSSLLCYFEDDRTNSFYPTIRAILDGKVMVDPVPGLLFSRRCTRNPHIQSCIGRRQHLPEFWFNLIGERSEHFADRLAHMRLRQQAVHARECLVDRHIAEIRIQNAKTQGRRIKIQSEERLHSREIVFSHRGQRILGIRRTELRHRPTPPAAGQHSSMQSVADR